MITPYFSIGAISQKAWRGVGAGQLDDCWLCADAQCVHGCAPWLGLFGAKSYREAAGVPDTATGAEGGSLDDGLKAIGTLYPSIAPLVQLYRGSWAGFEAAIREGHCASVSVWSATLTGTAIRHRIAVRAKDGQLEYINPLWAPYTVAKLVSVATLKKWTGDYPGTPEVNALVFPTVEAAFRVHPLYESAAGDTQAAWEAWLTTHPE